MHHFLIKNAGEDECRTDVWIDVLQWLQWERSSNWEDMNLEQLLKSDKRFLEILDAGTRKNGNHYQVPLPFKQKGIKIPNNRSQAVKRMYQLKRRFKKVLSEDQKNYFKDWCLMNSQPTKWIMAILSKVCKSDNFEPQNSLKLSFTNIRGCHLNFVDCESFLEWKSPDILALCKTNLDDSVDSCNFSVRGYLPLIQRILVLICMVLQFMLKDFLLHGTYPKKTLQILTYVFNWLYSTRCLTFFPLSITFFIFVQFFILFHLT